MATGGEDHKLEKNIFQTGELGETYHQLKAGKYLQLSERQKDAERKLGSKYMGDDPCNESILVFW